MHQEEHFHQKRVIRGHGLLARRAAVYRPDTQSAWWELLRVLKKGSNPQEEKSDLHEEKKNPQEEKMNLQEEKNEPTA